MDDVKQLLLTAVGLAQFLLKSLNLCLNQVDLSHCLLITEAFACEVGVWPKRKRLVNFTLGRPGSASQVSLERLDEFLELGTQALRVYRLLVLLCRDMIEHILASRVDVVSIVFE